MNIRKTLAIALTLGLSLSPFINTKETLASSDVLGVYEAQNKKSEEEIQKEYDLRLDLARYLASLEQENIRERILEEYKEAYDDEVARLFNYLNTKELNQDDIRNIESKSVLKSIIAVSVDETLSPLSDENQKIVREEVDAYMDGGILIENPILSEASNEKTYEKSDLLNLMSAIIGSKNFTTANIIYQESYGKIMKEASVVLEDELSDTQTIDLTYRNLLADARDLNENTKEEESQSEPTQVDPDINTDSDFYKNPKYKDAYLALPKENRDELDEMRKTPAKKPYLTIKQLLSINKYGLPIYSGDWPYVFMYDRNDNGMVGEDYQENAIASDENLAKAYRETSLENRYTIYKLDTNKDGYIDEDELNAAGIILDDENNRWIISFMKQTDQSSENNTESPLPQTTVLENTTNTQTQQETSPVVVEQSPNEQATQKQEVTTITTESPVNNQANVNSNSNVDTGISGSTPVIAILFASAIGYFNSKKSK